MGLSLLRLRLVLWLRLVSLDLRLRRHLPLGKRLRLRLPRLLRLLLHLLLLRRERGGPRGFATSAVIQRLSRGTALFLLLIEPQQVERRGEEDEGQYETEDYHSFKVIQAAARAMLARGVRPQFLQGASDPHPTPTTSPGTATRRAARRAPSRR